MTAVLVIILALALWLASPSRGAAGRRARKALLGAGQPAPATPSHGRSRLHGIGRVGHTADGNRRVISGPGRWLGRGSPGQGTVPMTVVVQQLAALLKGGRTPARLWDELWVLYGGQAAVPDAVRAPARGVGRGGRGGLAGPVLGTESLRILVAARAAALRGASVAAAIRRAATGDATGHGFGLGAALAPASARSGRDLRVWGEIAACFDTAEASGCPLADILARFAVHLEAEDDAEAARQTALAGPRATVRLLTWLPLSGLGLGLVLGVDPVVTLLGKPWGVLALTAGVVLTAGGRMWSSKLVRAAAGGQQ